jgi:DNA-binding transcriptional LysR family regulator
MNFSQIKCFLAAADCLSFTRASERLYLSQPVLSRQIAAMEEELGIELFVREKKSVRLTRAGEILSEGLLRLAGEYDSLIEKATAAHLGFAGNLNIGLVEGQLINPPYAPALDEFHRRYPDIRMNLSRHTMGKLHRAILSGEIDVAFSVTFNVEDVPELEYLEVAVVPTRLVIPRTHPLASKSNLHLDDFKNDTFLTLPEDESPYLARSTEHFKRNAFATLEAPDIGTLALWLEAGYGISALNSNHSLRFNPNLVFVEVPEYEDTVEVIAWRKDCRNPMVAAFAEVFRDFREGAPDRNV